MNLHVFSFLHHFQEHITPKNTSTPTAKYINEIRQFQKPLEPLRSAGETLKTTCSPSQIMRGSTDSSKLQLLSNYKGLHGPVKNRECRLYILSKKLQAMGRNPTTTPNLMLHEPYNYNKHFHCYKKIIYCVKIHLN